MSARNDPDSFFFVTIYRYDWVEILFEYAIGRILGPFLRSFYVALTSLCVCVPSRHRFMFFFLRFCCCDSSLHSVVIIVDVVVNVGYLGTCFMVFWGQT